ncbi:MAG: PIN domain nuclease [Chloroflexi bacterium]|nr:MAG: PIN domain nuclease [Chloroflexota bacterium]
MGWVDRLHGHLVGLDTAPLIYYLEEEPAYVPLVAPFFSAITDGNLRAVTSTVTLVEALTKPLREGHFDIAKRYRDLLLSRAGIVLEPVSAVIAEEAAQLRARHRVRTPDALQVATARLAGASHFLTNDIHLAGIPGTAIGPVEVSTLRPRRRARVPAAIGTARGKGVMPDAFALGTGA